MNPNKNDAQKNPTTVDRRSDREVAVTRIVNGPARLVFEAWTKADLFKRWWVPKAFSPLLLSCDIDARVGGTYRLVFRNPESEEPMAFFGSYTEVTPQRIVWTNEESGDAGAVTTVTLEEKGGKTLVTLRDLYRTKEALEAGIGSTDGMGETFDQLEELIGNLGAAA